MLGNYVRWQSSDVFVEIYFDSRRSYEFDARIGRLGVLINGNEIPYGLDEMARLGGLSWGTRAVRACSEAELDARLAEMAEAMKVAALRFLLNDTQAYVILQQQRERECTAYAEETELRRARETAEKAWKQGDFRTVVDTYKRHWQHLTPSERKRYEIALKRC